MNGLADLCHAIERQEHPHDARILASGARVTMPADEPTLGEVVRTLTRIERDLNARLDGLNARLDRVITAELYDAYQAAVALRFEAVEGAAEEMRANRQRDDDRRSADRRMVVGALIGAALSLVVALASAGLLIAFGLQGG